MASHALLKQCANEIRNGNKYWVNRTIFTSSLYCAKKERKLTQVKDRHTVHDDSLLLSKEERHYREAMDGYIIVPDTETLGAVSGVPEEHIKGRRVCIYRPAKSATQSGTNNINCWRIDFDTQQRWENPLMGWTSTGDPLSNMKVDFPSKETAIQHCLNMGWEFFLEKPNKKDPKPRTYGENFSWNKRTRVSTK